jgi:hypothetical protein
MTREQMILKAYSSAGLQRTELTREAKREALRNPKYDLRPEEIEELLNKLYPED